MRLSANFRSVHRFECTTKIFHGITEFCYFVKLNFMLDKQAEQSEQNQPGAITSRD